MVWYRCRHLPLEEPAVLSLTGVLDPVVYRCLLRCIESASASYFAMFIDAAAATAADLAVM